MYILGMHDGTKIEFPHDPVILCYRGSHAHGTYISPVETNGVDDIDLFGVCIPTLDYYFGTKSWEGKDFWIEHYDVVTYSFSKFIHLLLKGNPNCVGILWTRSQNILYINELGKELVQNRNLFLGKETVVKAFKGYAAGQMHKMTHFYDSSYYDELEEMAEKLRTLGIHGMEHNEVPLEHRELVAAHNKLKKKLYQGYMGEKRRKLVDKFGYDCYVESQTEFLTNNGWKKFDEIKKEDWLGTVDEDGTLQWNQAISKVDRLYTGKIYIIEPKGSRCVITENHNLLVSDVHRNKTNNFSVDYELEKSNWRLESFSALLNGKRSVFHYRRAPVPCFKDVKHESSIQFLKLMGLYLSEGTCNFRNGKLKSIRITQTENGKQEVFHFMDSLPIEWGFKRYNYEKEVIWISHTDIVKKLYEYCGHSQDKKVPFYVSDTYISGIEGLWEGLILGDGTDKKTHQVYYTSSKLLADSIQSTLLCGGIHCTINGPYRISTEYGTMDMYHVYRFKNPKPNNVEVLYLKRMLQKGDENKNKKDGFPIKVKDVKDERVVCFEVLNGTLVTRSNGKPAIHGNCKNASHLLRLLVMCVELLDTGEISVYRTHDAQTFIDVKQGKWTLDAVSEWAEHLFAEIRDKYDSSPLPEYPDYERVNGLVTEWLRDYYLRK